MYLLRCIVVVTVLATTLLVSARKMERVTQSLEQKNALRTETMTRAMMRQQHFERLAVEHGVTIEWINRIVEGATNAWTGFTSSVARLTARFSNGIKAMKDQTKYLLNMLQLKKPGGYTTAFCKHAKTDACDTVENYPWPRSLSKLKHADVREGLRTVAAQQKAGEIFRGNELGYLILNSKLWSSFGDDDTHTIGLGMSVEEHEAVRPVLDAVLGHGSKAWTKQQIRQSVKEFFENAPSRARPQMKQTLLNMKERCEDLSGSFWNVDEMCDECEGIEFCDGEKKKKFWVIPQCKCEFNQEKADRTLAAHDEENVVKRDVVRVQEDVKVWSTKLLHKIHMNMEISDEEAEIFTKMQSTMLVTTILPEALVDKIKFVSKLDEVKAYRKKMIPKYQKAIKDDTRGLVPDRFKTDERLNFLLASNMMDSLLFAGGLSVPSVISVTLAILFADGNSPMKLVDRHSLATEPEHMKVSQAVFESMRRYPPVVGFPWWNTAEKNDFRTVMNLAMAQRDPVAWGDDAESFVLRDLEKYAELMGVSWAAPETDWNPRDGWQESTGVHDYKGMARECPAKELSFVMSVEFIEGFLKDQIKNGSWKVQNNVEIHMTESTPFFNSFVLVRGLVENLGQCDSKKCELFEVAKEEIYKEMFPGAIDTRVPINLRGLFYMEGNPAPDDVASFGGSDWAFTDYQGYRGSNSDPSVDAQISVYGNRVWSWHNNALGKATYKKAAATKLTYNFHCDEAVTHCEITISTKRRGLSFVGGLLSSTADFTMTLCTETSKSEPRMEKCAQRKGNEILWIRKSTILGGITHEYIMRQIVDESGKPITGAWEHFLEKVEAPTLLLARPTDEVTFEEFVSDDEERGFQDAAGDVLGRKLKRLNPNDMGCESNVECLQTRRCFNGRCQALNGQVQDGNTCRLDKECMSEKCEGNRWGFRDGKCQGLQIGVASPAEDTRCKISSNPTTCETCVNAKHDDGKGGKQTNCAWCASLPTSVIRGACVKSASYCPKGSSFFASKSHPFNLAHDTTQEDGGVTWRTGAEVVPFDLTGKDISQCPLPSETTHEGLREFFDSSDFETTVQRLLSYKYATLDFFARANYNALVQSYNAWLEAMPTSSGNVKNFDPPGAFIGKSEEQGFAGIKIPIHDEDWIPVTEKEKFLTNLITQHISEGWGRSNLFMTKDVDLKYFTFYWDGKDPNNNKKKPVLYDWGLGALSTAPGQDSFKLVSPKAKDSIFTSGRSDEWRDRAVDAESQAFSTEFFDKLFPQPLAKYTISRVTSDQGLTDIFFDGPAIVFLRHVDSIAARNNHAGGFGGGGNFLLLLETFSSATSPPPDAEYVADLSYMHKYAVRKCKKDQKSCKDFQRYGFKMYFNANREPIQIEYHHGEHHVVKPGDPKWEEAKFVVRSSTITEITAIDHLLYSHLTVSNGGTRAATEVLGVEHQLRRFLKPFTFRANKINDQASRALFIRGGLVDRTFAFDPEIVGEYFDDMSKNFKYRTVPEFIKEVGIPLEKSTTLTDMKNFWDVMHTYAQEFVDLYWKNDKDVKEDNKIVAYWNFLQNEARTYKYGLPKLTKANLVNQLCHHTFWVTGMHKLVGNVADWLRTGARGFPTVMRDNDKIEADIQYFFVASTIAGFTGLPQVNLINDWNHLYRTDEEKEVGRKWQAALVTLADKVDQLNTERSFSSDYLNPRYLDSSVAI